MSKDFSTFCYTSHGHENWFYRKYYYSGSNCRYHTSQLVMNMLSAMDHAPVIVETGCQRLEDDIGAGMSTSIWGQFCALNGGRVYTVELSPRNLEVCKESTKAWAPHIEYILSDSADWLGKATNVKADLLYLDSLDYDYGGLLNIYGGKDDTQAAVKAVDGISFQEIMARHSDIILPAQNHCLNELKAAFASGLAHERTIIMIDDNQLPGGGKSRLAKGYLASIGWSCLLDFQQSVWVKRP